MSDTSGTPSGTPGGTPSNSGGNFMRDRVSQLASSMAEPAERPAMPPQTPPQPEINPRSRGHSPARDLREQLPHTPADQKVYGDYTAAQIDDAFAFKAEADIRKHTLPKSEAEYLAKNSDSFKLPEGVGSNFQFDEKDAHLAQARKVALKHGVSQEAFSEFLDVFAAREVGPQIQQHQARQRNLDALGAAGPQRMDAVSTWLRARVGDTDGKAVADFISRFPSAPMVRTFERLIRQFSNQGGADYSASHRETHTQEPGKIAGYENMSFAQKRAHQISERMRSDPNYARGQRPGGDR